VGGEDPEDWEDVSGWVVDGRSLGYFDLLTNDDRKESDNVQNQEKALDKRKLLGQSSVEEDRESGHRNDKERTMPRPLSLQCVLFVVQGNQSLDDRSA
jgi:hypothetical protein